MGILRSQWAEFKDMVDAYSIVYMEGLLLVPVVMFALFYPLEVLLSVVVVLMAGLAVFETVLYFRHHPHHAHHAPPRKDVWRFPL